MDGNDAATLSAAFFGGTIMGRFPGDLLNLCVLGVSYDTQTADLAASVSRYRIFDAVEEPP